MDSLIPISEDIYYIGVNDRETALFEAIWPLPRGVSYNSYLIDDEQVAMVDCVKAGFLKNAMVRIDRVLDGRKIDYLIVNHMEPDHSGAIQSLKARFPEIKIVGNDKTVRFLREFYGIEEGLYVVQDGDTLDLGKHKLKFLLTPMVHWPETMVTYDNTSKVIFTGDAFGGFGALEGGIFDDEVDVDYYEEEILRYFTNIVGKFSAMVQKAIGRVKDLEISVVASTHGIVWRENPQMIIDLYDKWSRQETEPGITLVYCSMYGNTAGMAESIGLQLARSNVENVRIHNLSQNHPSFVINDVWRYNGLLLGTPTYNVGMFPLMDNFVRMVESQKLKHRYVGLFGTYGWSGGGVKNLKAFAEGMKKWDLIEPVVEAQCSPKAGDLEQCRQLGRNLAEAVLSEA